MSLSAPLGGIRSDANRNATKSIFPQPAQHAFAKLVGCIATGHKFNADYSPTLEQKGEGHGFNYALPPQWDVHE
jgi:hypothetical protein